MVLIKRRTTNREARSKDRWGWQVESMNRRRNEEEEEQGTRELQGSAGYTASHGEKSKVDRNRER